MRFQPRFIITVSSPALAYQWLPRRATHTFYGCIVRLICILFSKDNYILSSKIRTRIDLPAEMNNRFCFNVLMWKLPYQIWDKEKIYNTINKKKGFYKTFRFSCTLKKKLRREKITRNKGFDFFETLNEFIKIFEV